MKSFILVVLAILVFLAGTVQAESLRWDAPPAGNVTGYIVYYGEQSGSRVYHSNVGNVTLFPNFNTVLPLQPGVEYFFIIRAYNGVGESLDSNEVSFTVPAIYTPPADVGPVALPAPEPPTGAAVI